MVIQEPAGHNAQTLKVGNDVCTFDGKRIGTIKDSTDQYFRVHVRWGRDFWLSRELIHDCTPGRVTLHISDDSVDNYKTRQAEAPTAGRPGGEQPEPDDDMELTLRRQNPRPD